MGTGSTREREIVEGTIGRIVIIRAQQTSVQTPANKNVVNLEVSAKVRDQFIIPNLHQKEFNFNNNIFKIVIQEVQAEIQEDQNKNEPDNRIKLLIAELDIITRLESKLIKKGNIMYLIISNFLLI